MDTPDSERTTPVSSPPTHQFNQTNVGNQGQIIGQMTGETVIGQVKGEVAIGQLNIFYLSQTTTATATTVNPYKGLRAFQEADHALFFGREHLTAALHDQFAQLHQQADSIRILAIYGPSGSGKSSIARAGLIPALGKDPLPGKETARVVVITPGEAPLRAIATVLARIATNDPLPLAKTDELEQYLRQSPDQQEYPGLTQIAKNFPGIQDAPLIILVDQFEELYTLCRDETERRAFVRNLLAAASTTQPHVSVILTMRSDFLGATQQHPRLNALFASPANGRLIPVMQRDELAAAIAKPARQHGHPLDPEVVQTLLAETQGQEGTLPLLQFALTQIWEGMVQEPPVSAIATLERIGGVGGGLARTAQDIYEALTPTEQAIARRIFLSLIQLNDNNQATRRRALLQELVPQSHSKDEEQTAIQAVKAVIQRFASPGFWILVTFSQTQAETTVEMVEVAHEALIRNWQTLQTWLKDRRQTLRQKQKIETAANEWMAQNRAKDNLLSGKPLRDAKEYHKANHTAPETQLSETATTFLHASTRRKQINTLKLASIFCIFPLIGSLFAVHLLILNHANAVLSQDDCKPDTEAKFLLEYLWWTRNANNLRDLKICRENLWSIAMPDSLIEDSDFRKANLANSDFRGAIISNSDFTETNLMLSDLGCSDENCAALVGIKFHKTNLSGSNLKNTVLTNSDFRQANLSNANLSGAKGVSEEQLKDAQLCKTTLPEDLKLSGDRDCEKN